MLQRTWPAEGLTRVPYWVYQDADSYQREQERIFRGPTWSYLCLEAELAEPKSFLTTFIGDMPVVVARDADGALHAFENRCAHRGALIAMQARGKTDRFACIYHNWTYDHAGNLTSVAFRKGIAGKGGMPADAHPESQAPKKLRVESIHGLVFGTLSAATASLADYIGPQILPRLERVMVKPLKVLGTYTQVLPKIRNSLAARQVVPKGIGRTELNWTLFGFADDDEAMLRRRLLQANLVGPAGYISMEDGAATGFVQRGVAASPERASVIEMGGATIGSGDSRITETAVRGLWKAWRSYMSI